MMRWGRKKPVSSGSSSASSSSSSSSSSSGLSRALPVSWFSKFSGISVAGSDLKPAKDKKNTEEVSKNISAKSSLSSTKRLDEIHESSNKVLVGKENTVGELDCLATGFHTSRRIATRSTDMESDEKFEVIMKSLRKKVRDFKRETGRSLDVEVMDGEKGTVIMTPRIKTSKEKQRFDRRDQRLLDQKQQRIKERDAEMKVTKPAGRTGTLQNLESVHSNSKNTGGDSIETEQKPAHQWQKLKEIKLREVKLKADQQRKSMYIRRELNRLDTKENNRVKVFSPRASSRAEKCRVKAIEDLKKAKLRAREHELVTSTDGGMENESFAVVKCSSDPQKDFRDSMIEMIMENGINNPEELKELLVCYLRLNTDEYHDMIIKVFQQVHNDLNCYSFGAEK